MSWGQEIAVTAPFAGVVVSLAHEPDAPVAAGTALLVLEAMKMEHEVLAETGGVVRRIEVSVGDAVEEGQTLLVLSPRPDRETAETSPAAPPSTNGFRADLEAVRERHALEPIVKVAFQAFGKTLASVIRSNAGAPLGYLETAPRIGITLRNELVNLGLDVRLQVLDPIQRDAEVMKYQPAILDDRPDAVLLDEVVRMLPEPTDEDAVGMFRMKQILDVPVQADRD